jgi:large subunit ribosomal protein L5
VTDEVSHEQDASSADDTSSETTDETTEMTPPEAMTADETASADMPGQSDATEEAASTDAAPEPAAEAAPEPAVEAAPEPAAEAAPEPAAEAAPEPAADAPAEAAAEPKPTTRRERATAQRAAAIAEPGPASAMARTDGLRGRYRDEVVPALQKEFNYTNPNQVPRLTKIVVNIGLGEALTNAKALDAAVGDLAQITGQKPIVTRARRSIAQFRLRTGNPIGAKVTLRGQRMWDFLERLTRLALPRIRDFRGVPSKSFDGRGNYSLGLREQLAFPEIDYDKIDRLRGLEVSIVTTATTDEESKRLLQLLGMPFAGQNG